MKHLIAATFTLVCLANAGHAITYEVFRSFANGSSVTGTIETNGKIGAITDADVLSWQLDLFSPVDLFGTGMMTDSISSAGALSSSFIGVSASATDLFLTPVPTTVGLGSQVLLQGASFNGWCISAFANCADVPSDAGTEIVFFTEDITVAASSPIAGDQVFASVAPEVGVVPLPASLPLLLAGFAGLGIIAQRRRKSRV